MIRMASALREILLRGGRAAAPERGAQTGHRGAVSYPGLVADADHPQAGGEQLLDQVVLFVVERRAAEVRDRRSSASAAGRRALVEGALARLPDAVGDHVHRRLEIELLPRVAIRARGTSPSSARPGCVSSSIAGRALRDRDGQDVRVGDEACPLQRLA